MAAPAEATLARDVARWVREHWREGLTLREWWGLLFEHGYAFPTWPAGLGGRDATHVEAQAIRRALDTCGVIGPPTGVGQALGAPTLLAHGSPDQQGEFVPPLARGEEAWCQLFSEPGAGSDLPSLQTTAVADGDRWIVNGQKVWSSGAHLADRGLLLARTDRSAPKRNGLSYFVIDMEQPGVEVRPLRQMNGEAEFCEVFLTDATVPAGRQVGAPGAGWQVARTTLAFERANVAARRGAAPTAPPGSLAGCLDRTVEEIVERHRRAPRTPVAGFVVGNRTLDELAGAAATSTLPRHRRAAFRTLTELNRMNGLRARATAGRDGRPGAESSISKLAISNIARTSRDLAFELMGANGMLDGEDAPLDGAVHRVALASFGASIGGGTDEIQRNAIAERTLGLPKDVELDEEPHTR